MSHKSDITENVPVKGKNGTVIKYLVENDNGYQIGTSKHILPAPSFIPVTTVGGSSQPASWRCGWWTRDATRRLPPAGTLTLPCPTWQPLHLQQYAVKLVWGTEGSEWHTEICVFPRRCIPTVDHEFSPWRILYQNTQLLPHVPITGQQHLFS
jgi:hypothetical protein